MPPYNLTRLSPMLRRVRQEHGLGRLVARRAGCGAHGCTMMFFGHADGSTGLLSHLCRHGSHTLDLPYPPSDLLKLDVLNRARLRRLAGWADACHDADALADTPLGTWRPYDPTPTTEATT